MDHPPLQVKVVSADREVWKGSRSISLFGLPRVISVCSPVMRPFLRPSRRAQQIITTDGNREVIACDGGFVALDNDGQVSIITQYATRSEEISVDQARRDRDSLRKKLNEHERSEQDPEVVQDLTHRLHLAQAQIAAARLAGKQRS